MIRQWIRRNAHANRFLALLCGSLMLATAAQADQDPHWQANYKARAAFFEETIGPVPDGIVKMVTLGNVWPGGGLMVIPASRLDDRTALYTTFGLSNPDMPAKSRLVEVPLDPVGKPEPSEQAEATLAPVPPGGTAPGTAGYGYEVAVVADSGQKWPIGMLQWAVDAEIVKDAGLLEQVDRHGGLTLENLRVGLARSINMLITRARPPLPTGADLPAGRMELLIATTITSEELRWSQDNGPGALVDKMQAAGIGQRSVIDRPSVVP